MNVNQKTTFEVLLGTRACFKPGQSREAGEDALTELTRLGYGARCHVNELGIGRISG